MSEGGRGFFSFLALTLVLFYLMYLFVWLQRALVSDATLFFALIFGLIISSFWSSATEAAFSIALRKSEISEAVDDELLKTAERMQPLDERIQKVGSTNLSSREQKQWKKVQRKVKRLRKKQDAFSEGSRRDEFVGSLAALSVFLNASLAAFLPLALMQTAPERDIVNLIVPYSNPTIEIYSFTWPKALVFVASSLPILILGKIVPKMIGLSKPKFFAYNCYWLANMATFLFGWIAAGSRWPIGKAIKD